MPRLPLGGTPPSVDYPRMTEVSRDSLDTLTEGGRGTLPSVESVDVQSIREFCDHTQEVLQTHCYELDIE